MAKKKFSVELKRTPVIAVMGHVDHGKTSLLDAIRGTSVQEGEQGGITQNTRAHEVTYNDYKITFIDTPGHEAFSDMRSRGAQLTDMVLLVVAGDDGIQPQTKESIKFAKDSGTPLIVAVNKSDLPGINLDKIKNALSQNDVLVEDYGGDVQVFETSATTKTGLDELLEGILLQAELLEMKKEKSERGHAKAVVLESTLDKNLGAIALVLMKSGDVKVGEYLTNGKTVSSVRAVLDEYQKSITEATESQPVWIVGIEEVFKTGEVVYFADTDKATSDIQKEIQAEEEEEKRKAQAEEIANETEVEEVDDLSLLATLLAKEQVEDDIKKLNVVVKTDTQGTLEVTLNELDALGDEEVKIHVLSAGTGEITRKDIMTAKNGRGIVLGFQVTVPSDLTTIIQQEKVLVRTYGVIYELIEEVSEAMESMIEPEEIDEDVATALVKKIFILSNGDRVAGCSVESGKIIKGYRAKVLRGEEEVGRGKITLLKHNKNEVKEMQKGTECGILIEPQIEIEEGDMVVLFKVVKS